MLETKFIFKKSIEILCNSNNQVGNIIKKISLTIPKILKSARTFEINTCAYGKISNIVEVHERRPK